jgi:hypothetical protein
MGGDCSAYGREERPIHLWETRHLEDLGVDGRIMLRWRLGCGCMHWFDLSQDKDGF